MKLSLALSFLSLASVQAVGQLAFDLGVQRNSDAGCKSTDDYLTDFKNIGSESSIVRVYAVSDCNTLQQLGPALGQANFKAFLGIWPNDDTHYAAEKAALQQYLPQISVDNVVAFTVGSEALYRGDMSVSDLSDRITDIKNLLKGIKDKDGKSYSSKAVGTVDSWNVLVDGANQQVIETADLVMANAFSYWQGQVMSNASFSFVDDIMQVLQVIQTVKGNNEVDFWVGETGWPTGGGNFESAEPSVDNAQQFWKEGICGIRGWGVNTIVFEAFDETWKPVTSGVDGVENHWGVWDGSGKLKFDLSCDFGN